MAGRPPFPPGVAKSAQIIIRMTPAEKEMIFQAAAAAGMTVSAFMLGLALGDRLGGLLKGEGFTSTSEALAHRMQDSKTET